MRTLDEVIEALRCTNPEVDPETKCNDCPYKEFHMSDLWYVGPSCLDVMFADALHYLKVLKDILDPLKVKKITHEITCPQCNSVIAILLPESNEPLTWEELKQMEGKPVWVELLKGKWKGWDVIAGFDEDDFGVAMVTVRGDYYYKADLGKTWQAYRKERE